jgi:hypothetical protein
MLRSTLLIGALILGAGTGAFSAGTASKTESSQGDMAAFHDHLVNNKLDIRWEGEPARLDSEEIRRAYRDRRFYFTFKARPVPPGAALPDLIAEYKQKMQEYRKHALRITVGIDNKGHAATFRTTQDFNLGLMAVKTDDDARIAAGAILSLIGNDQVSPGVISSREVTVERTNAGWTCLVSRAREFDGKVVFDPSGHCTSAIKNLNYIPPVPR